MSASLAPPPPGGMAAGAAISVGAHLGLLAALALAVQWRLPAPQPVAAELWATVPQAAAPPAAQAPSPVPPAEAPAPPPPVAPAPPEPAPAQAAEQAAREADIAREREARRRAEAERAARERAEREKAAQQKAAEEKAARAERQRQERERAQQQQQQKAEQAERRRAEQQKAEQQKAEEARLARQREENLKRLMGQIPAGTGTSAGTAAVDAAPSAAYAGRLVQAIFPNIVFQAALPGNPAAVVEVRAGPNGSVIGRRLVTSSGHPEWDEAVLRAIDRTGTLPRDADGRVPPVITITFRPR